MLIPLVSADEVFVLDLIQKGTNTNFDVTLDSMYTTPVTAGGTFYSRTDETNCAVNVYDLNNGGGRIFYMDRKKFIDEGSLINSETDVKTNLGYLVSKD